MTDLVVRKLLIDLNTPFAVRWNGGDAFRSAFFNALSMSFPLGEQYFMDSVRAGLKSLPEDQRARFAAEVQGFVGQEATHRRIHSLFNGHLETQGFTNALERRAAKRMQASAHMDVRVHVGATAATEHLTAIFADWMLAHPEALEGSEERLQTLWLWHSAEESEHRSTAFDVYQAIGGNHEWRLRLFRYITFTFFSDVTRQTIRNLWHDKALFRWSTWRSAGHFLFGKDGFISSNRAQWRAYLREDFHPRQQDGARSEQWLRDNSAQFTVVGQPT
ncbi:MAG: metal-dependent hydrolase [Curvibacter sp. RIFCSPHIGHO2_12_FULL_63_18]|uniref:metal-dependent hydrolase n=1 Tax=Rhodoferax sp. TaxID=50421 RepID=UPI0008AFFED1|nr:metal-dependent hydrolase [Rhodoferax sp.]OGO96700.1 MAG: metal-dependent hydrolase [Curvibacter sp. GWA2_63_95]OGO98583.1 MAG: metal-dependent hydrolase [Curvibacter sp. RIFCSPHIGHO2_12_FULL_63_18]HCX82621.1 metal-dependent hydrolase [Rhodoferax sp.]